MDEVDVVQRELPRLQLDIHRRIFVKVAVLHPLVENDILAVLHEMGVEVLIQM